MEENEIFSGFEDVLLRSTDISFQSRKNASPELLAMFDRGKEELFEGLKRQQPLTFSSIMKYCGDLRILITGRAFGYELPFAGMRWFDRILVCDNYSSMGLDMEDRHGMRCLPVPFGCYYETFNGLNSCAAHQIPSTNAFDLPKSLYSWMSLENYRKLRKIKAAKLEKFLSSVGPGDFRIWMHGTHGDLILVNYDNPQHGPLYHVHKDNFDDFAILDKPAEKMDSYFAHVISGSAEPFSFRN